MPINWRQGDTITHDTAAELGLEMGPDSCIAIIASHSCDLANNEDNEPEVEVIDASKVTENAAKFQNGHNIRKLHVSILVNDNASWYELDIRKRRLIEKSRLQRCTPREKQSLSLDDRAIFKRWLAQRYSRSEFPDTFNEWLRQSRVVKKLEKVAKKYTNTLVGIYFDLDDDTERQASHDPYALGIYLVYDADNTENADRAGRAAEELTAEFMTRCYQGNSWQWIELLYCEAISEQVFPLHAARQYRRWRLEHRSSSGEPLDNADE